MIAQTVAARSPGRVRRFTSIMSTTGAPRIGRPALSAWRRLATAKPPRAATRRWNTTSRSCGPSDRTVSLRRTACPRQGGDRLGPGPDERRHPASARPRLPVSRPHRRTRRNRRPDIRDPRRPRPDGRSDRRRRDRAPFAARRWKPSPDRPRSSGRRVGTHDGTDHDHVASASNDNTDLKEQRPLKLGRLRRGSMRWMTIRFWSRRAKAIA